MTAAIPDLEAGFLPHSPSSDSEPDAVAEGFEIMVFLALVLEIDQFSAFAPVTGRGRRPPLPALAGQSAEKGPSR